MGDDQNARDEWIFHHLDAATAHCEDALDRELRELIEQTIRAIKEARQILRSRS
jgi:hypothetical protein